MKRHIKLFEEFVQGLNEANEEIMAANTIQGTMFKIQKKLEFIFKKIKDEGYFEDYNLKIKRYNAGYKLDFNIDINALKLSKKVDQDSKLMELIYGLYNVRSIDIQPDTFFDDHIEKDENTSIEYHPFNFDSKYETKREIIKQKSDIKPALRKIEKEYMEKIEEFKIKLEELMK